LINERVQLREHRVTLPFGVVHRISSHRVSDASDCKDSVARPDAPSLRNGAPSPLLLTVPQAALVLGIGTTRLYELVATGELQSVRIGRSRRIARADIDEFVERLRGVKGT
jgi:excisionase family DNA binding protein